MKKFMAIFISLAIVAFAFAGCSTAAKNTNGTSSIASSDDSSSSSTVDDSSSSDVSSSSSDASSAVSSAASSAVSSAASSTVSTVATSAKTAAAVTSTVKSGTYTSARYVILKDSTSGTSIYYTTNGSAPTTGSTKYTGPFTVSKTTTVSAIAVASGYSNSAAANFSYTINSPTNLPGDITADGSTALQPLLTAITPLFEDKFSSAFRGSIAIGGGGSGTGLNDVESGVVKLGDSDVSVAQAGKNMSDLVDHEVCIVGVAVVVSNNVKLTSVSSDTLYKIFTGAYTDWNQVPGYTGTAHKINVIYRKSGSGTRILFETYGLKLSSAQQTSFSYVSGATVANASTEVATDVATDYSIGYETIPYTNGLKKLSIDFGSGAVACNYDNIDSGAYKIWGFEHIFTKGAPSSTTQAFIDFITSADSVSTIKNNGYGLTTDLKSGALALNH